MKTRSGLAGLVMILMAAGQALAEHETTGSNSRSSRSGYSYVRLVTGEVTINSRWNGRVEARRNMPVSAGDEMVVRDGGRAEIALADGNLLHVGGGTRARFDSLYAQQGEKDDFSSVTLREGSVILTAVGANEKQIPRIDTEEATVYLEPGSRVRVNTDRRRGTVVIARSGTVEVRTRQGTQRLRAGQYLTVEEDEEPEIERGAFSRDRFDLWSADRIEALYETRSASARYVREDYASDVVALDGYGDWNYSATHASYVWSPRVNAGWSPYSYGSWYYTPAGLTWWSNDPWGWYPYHYGTWLFDASWSRWCWRPAYAYSPAWVYWAYTPSYVGWCPIGYYSFYSPWYDNYYRRLGWHNRGNIYISLHGTFDSRRVDFRGWNFAGSSNIAAVGRMEVVPASRVVDRLGAQIAISSRPFVVSARQGEGREAVQDFVQRAPRVIERTAMADSARLAPVLARERTLPNTTVEALRERAVVVGERGGLAGPGAADIAPRGAVVDRGRDIGEILRREPAPVERGRAGLETPGREAREVGVGERGERGTIERSERGRTRIETEEGVPGRDEGRTIARPGVDGDWRSRDSARPSEGPAAREAPARERSESRDGASEVLRPERSEARPPSERRIERDRSDSGEGSDWRSRGRLAPVQPSEGEAREPRAAAPEARSAEPARDADWRSRSESPARRVIEGAVPNRRAPESSMEEAPPPRESAPREWRMREREPAREYRREPPSAPRGERPAFEPRGERSAPAPQRMEPAPRSERSAPAPQRMEPAPRSERPAAPPQRERAAPAPPSRGEVHREAPPPQAEVDKEAPPGTDGSSTDAGSTDASSDEAASTDVGSTDTSSTDTSADDTSATDAGPTDASSVDTSSTDTSSDDTSATDAGPTDASSVDTSSTDTSSDDAGSTDTDSTDAGSVDTSSTDTGSTDTSSADAGSTDTSSADAGSTDSSSADAGSTDAGSADTSSDDTGSSDTSSAEAGSTDAGSTDSSSADVGSTDTSATDAGPTESGPPDQGR